MFGPFNQLLICLLIGLFANNGLAESQSDRPVQLKRQQIADRLLRPWDMVFLSSTEALVTEKEGGLQQVNLLTGAKLLVTGLPDDVDNINKTGLGDNSGLFGIALAPDFKQSHQLYLSYAAKGTKGTTTKVIRAEFRDSKLSNIKQILTASPFSVDRYHYGGGLVFGQDNKLYVTVGERLFNEKDEPPLPIAQDPQDKRGKIYRFNPDGSIPVDNPELKESKNRELQFDDAEKLGIYALGIRAAQGMTVHPKTGDIWFSEHGTRQGDEINILQAGANYGWPIKTTGGYRFQEYNPPILADREFTPPVWSWEHTVAPTGLTFYEGNEFPDWKGNLLLTGLSRGSFWRFIVKDRQVLEAEELFVEDRIRLRNVKQAPDGKLYLLTDEANGRILRIVHNRSEN